MFYNTSQATKHHSAFICLGIVILLAGSSLAMAQFPGRGPQRDRRAGVPEWHLDEQFHADVFTFARVEYDSVMGGRGGRGGRGFGRGFGGGFGGGWFWRVDYPNSDLNFSFRLEQLTSLKVDPNGKTIRLTDPELRNYPFLYLTDPRALMFNDEEVSALRSYLEDGGFLMVDDFWGDRMWDHFHTQIKRVFPEKEPLELPLEHPIFNFIFPLKKKPQVPSEDAAHEGAPLGITWETNIGEPDSALNTPHYRALLDNKNRLMALFCHNTDIGDGWEEEGVSEWFFKEFSEKYSYPLGINVLFYVMTH